jgi:hypothetical protein
LKSCYVRRRPIGNNGSYKIPLVATAKREQGHTFPIRRLISQCSLVQLYSGKGNSLANFFSLQKMKKTNINLILHAVFNEIFLERLEKKNTFSHRLNLNFVSYFLAWVNPHPKVKWLKGINYYIKANRNILPLFSKIKILIDDSFTAKVRLQ